MMIYVQHVFTWSITSVTTVTQNHFISINYYDRLQNAISSCAFSELLSLKQSLISFAAQLCKDRHFISCPTGCEWKLSFEEKWIPKVCSWNAWMRSQMLNVQLFCVSAVDAVAAQIRQFKTFQSGVDVVTSQMMMQCVKVFCFWHDVSTLTCNQQLNRSDAPHLGQSRSQFLRPGVLISLMQTLIFLWSRHTIQPGNAPSSIGLFFKTKSAFCWG